MTNYLEEQIPGLISTARSVASQVEPRLGGLTGDQLNWKPSAESWSVAQCLDHLRTANNGYFPAFEKALQGDRSESMWARLPWIPAFWGRALIKVVSPDTAKKGKAPKIFHPASSTIDDTIVPIPRPTGPGHPLPEGDRRSRSGKDHHSVPGHPVDCLQLVGFLPDHRRPRGPAARRTERRSSG